MSTAPVILHNDIFGCFFLDAIVVHVTTAVIWISVKNTLTLSRNSVSALKYCSWPPVDWINKSLRRRSALARTHENTVTTARCARSLICKHAPHVNLLSCLLGLIAASTSHERCSLSLSAHLMIAHFQRIQNDMANIHSIANSNNYLHLWQLDRHYSFDIIIPISLLPQLG